jgi:hypothetical protein
VELGASAWLLVARTCYAWLLVLDVRYAELKHKKWQPATLDSKTCRSDWESSRYHRKARHQCAQISVLARREGRRRIFYVEFDVKCETYIQICKWRSCTNIDVHDTVWNSDGHDVQYNGVGRNCTILGQGRLGIAAGSYSITRSVIESLARPSWCGKSRPRQRGAIIHLLYSHR